VFYGLLFSFSLFYFRYCHVCLFFDLQSLITINCRLAFVNQISISSTNNYGNIPLIQIGCISLLYFSPRGISISLFISSLVDLGYNHRRVKSKTILLIDVASPLGTQHYGVSLDDGPTI
jgi:hypothetical protein